VTSHLLPTYARVDLAFERGEGPWLFATNGERYLDFTGGVAVNGLGHAHPYLVETLNEQARKIWHVSNLFRIPEAERLAGRLCAETFANLAFFCNSGAEAMECAIRVARTGSFFAYQRCGVEPDVMGVAKTIGGGFPLEEPDIADAIGRIDRAAERIERAQRDRQATAGVTP
jgi:acetylornithine/succinyldiaminopimelate/putrescine aminotransferase